MGLIKDSYGDLQDNVQVESEWVYYLADEKDFNHNLYRVKKDGTRKKRISAEESSMVYLDYYY